MLRFTARALAACASIAAITLLASTASAQLPQQRLLQTIQPTAEDFGPNGEDPEAGPELGRAVVIRDGLAFIGLPGREPGGRVGVYSSTASSLVRTSTVATVTPTRGERFGSTLTYRDGILVVGANKAAYVFQRSNGVWTQRQKLTPPAADNVFTFADSLRYEDGTLAIGANVRSHAQRPGAVYLYQRDSAGKFIARGKLTDPNSSISDGFGASISTAGPVMVVGAPNKGHAYIYRRNSSGVWQRTQTLVPSDRGTRPDGGRGGFGTAVAIDRQMIIVGAPFTLDDQSDFRGAAYGFTPGGGIYVATFMLEPSQDDFRHFFFGRQVAMFDQRIVIGAQSALSSDSELNGFVAVTYARAGSTVTPRSLVVSHLVGTSLSLANYRLLVGQPCSTAPGLCSGRASFYNLNVFE
jgi:FG-GAP repeat